MALEAVLPAGVRLVAVARSGKIHQYFGHRVTGFESLALPMLSLEARQKIVATLDDAGVRDEDLMIDALENNISGLPAFLFGEVVGTPAGLMEFRTPVRVGCPWCVAGAANTRLR